MQPYQLAAITAANTRARRTRRARRRSGRTIEAFLLGTKTRWPAGMDAACCLACDSAACAAGLRILPCDDRAWLGQQAPVSPARVFPHSQIMIGSSDQVVLFPHSPCKAAAASEKGERETRARARRPSRCEACRCAINHEEEWRRRARSSARKAEHLRSCGQNPFARRRGYHRSLLRERCQPGAGVARTGFGASLRSGAKVEQLASGREH